MISHGVWQGERVTGEDFEGEAICVWQPVIVDGQEVGYAMDFRPEHIDDLIALLQELKTTEPVMVVIEDPTDTDLRGTDVQPQS